MTAPRLQDGSSSGSVLTVALHAHKNRLQNISKKLYPSAFLRIDFLDARAGPWTTNHTFAPLLLRDRSPFTCGGWKLRARVKADCRFSHCLSSPHGWSGDLCNQSYRRSWSRPSRARSAPKDSKSLSGSVTCPVLPGQSREVSTRPGTPIST